MRLLVATGVAVEESKVPTSVVEIIHSASQILVMSAGLVGSLQWLTGDVDVRDTSPTTGSPRSLRTAFDDALRGVEAEHVIIGMSAEDYVVWHRQRVVEYLLGVGLPVTMSTTAF